jgi:hypothetical protein
VSEEGGGEERDFVSFKLRTDCGLDVQVEISVCMIYF